MGWEFTELDDWFHVGDKEARRVEHGGVVKLDIMSKWFITK